MNSEMQKKLYEMEVAPPGAVWEKLSPIIDEINLDNDVAKKMMNAEWEVPAGIWHKIDSRINTVSSEQVSKKAPIINLRRLAAAAIFIGVVVTAWLLLRNTRSDEGITGVENSTQQKTSIDTNTKKENKDSNLSNSPIDQSTVAVVNEPQVSSNKVLASATIRTQSRSKKDRRVAKRDASTVQPSDVQFASFDEPLGKNFNQPIDDLSLVTSDQNYFTMVNANGRLVKIPAQLASIATHLQDKPVPEDYYEVMFGEGAYWKETLNEWRRKLVSAPASGDAFTGFVELLKSVQNK